MSRILNSPLYLKGARGVKKYLTFKTKISLILFFFAFTVSGQTTDSLNHPDPDNIDVKLFRSINNNRSKFLDAVLPYTDVSVFPITIALPVTLIAYGELDKKYYVSNTGVLLSLSLILSEGTALGVKNIVKRKRPYMSLDNVHKRDIGFSDPYSFPSGHTNSAFTITTIFMLRYTKYPYVYVPMYAWSLIVAYGRSYFGMHYPVDLLGGAVIGTLSSALIYSIRSPIIKAKNRLFNEPNKPDENVSSKFAGYFAGTFILISLLNEFVLPGNGRYHLDMDATEESLLNLQFGVRF